LLKGELFELFPAFLKGVFSYRVVTIQSCVESKTEIPVRRKKHFVLDFKKIIPVCFVPFPFNDGPGTEFLQGNEKQNAYALGIIFF
jgi:hypothetical protein